MADYCPYVDFTFFNSLGQKLNIPNDLVVNAIWARTLNGVGTAIITMPSDCTDLDWDMVKQEDLGLLISVADRPGQIPVPDLETFWFLRRFREKITDKKGSFVLTFKDANHLLDRRVVAFRADEPEGSEPSARIDDPGNVALRRIFDTNYSTGAASTRDLSPFLTSAGIAAPSVNVEKEIPWKNVLRVMQQICRTSRDKGQPLFFDLVAIPTASDVRFEFRTYINQRGQDKLSERIHTSEPLFNLTTFEIDYDVPNTAYAAGIGRGQSRLVGFAISDRATAGRYTRFETFKSVRTGLDSVLNDEAQNLVNDVSGLIRLEGQLLGSLANSFDFGDRVLVNHRGEDFVCEVTSISSSLSAQVYTREVIVKSVGETSGN